jgi:hypothetical protein
MKTNILESAGMSRRREPARGQEPEGPVKRTSCEEKVIPLEPRAQDQWGRSSGSGSRESAGDTGTLIFLFSLT